MTLWRASDGRRTFRDVAADLNVNPETLRTWVRDGDDRPASAAASQDTEAELARLRARATSFSKSVRFDHVMPRWQGPGSSRAWWRRSAELLVCPLRRGALMARLRSQHPGGTPVPWDVADGP
ncbi:transposase [Streptomyces atratus]|uniref:transposase n=1 Tax=Streptomyces atratus TaxID=1893 RepID=UPI0038D03D5E